MIAALCKEIHIRKLELKDQKISTIYFGGGTPSILSQTHLSSIMEQIRGSFSLNESLEVTIEANPEDIDSEALSAYKRLGVHRLSMGIQSFDDEVLRSMNRSHDSAQALRAVRSAQEVGIENITVDLIYGLPDRTMKDFEETLDRFLALGVPHISAYALTIEPRTLYHHQVKEGSLVMPTEEMVGQQFFVLRKRLWDAGYEQYEVSNFSKPGYISKHNSAYWRGVPYMGVGPSAHSFDGNNRSWNVSNNHAYMKAIESERPASEKEALDTETRYNEYILTRLRTKWGLDLAYVRDEFGIDIIEANSAVWKRYEGRYTISNGHLILDPEGLILADGLASDLFQVA